MFPMAYSLQVMRCMRYIALIFLLVSSVCYGNDLHDIAELAHSNGFEPDKRVLMAIVAASRRYGIDAKELTAIGILETGLGKYAKTRDNSNGTQDAGIFQINSVNTASCIEYNLESIEGNAYCAAKLLKRIAKRHNDYLGRYHSKTPKRKIAYQNAIKHVLGVQAFDTGQKLDGFSKRLVNENR
jgi:hypothetical protein